MIYYNSNTINDWNFGDDNIIKVYKHGAVCYYKITSGDTPTPVQEPCFAVVDDITQYSDTEFEDVYDKATEKWYKLNNLNQYEEYGIYGSGRTITTYEGKLTIDGDYEYIYSGSSWVNVGEVSGTSITIKSPEYIERTSSYTGRMSLDYVWKTNSKMQFKFYSTNNGGGAMIGESGTPDTNDCRMFFASTSAYFDWGSSRINWSSNGQRNTLYEYEYGNYYIKNMVTSASKTGPTISTSRTNPLYFGLGGSDYFRAYYVKFYEGDTLVKDFIPWTDTHGNFGLYEKVSNTIYSATSGSFTASSVWNDVEVGGGVEYPLEYLVREDPPDNLVFSSMEEAEAYECPWVGMKATIAGDKYVFSGDSQSGYEWVYQPPSACEYNFCGVDANGNDVIINNGTTTLARGNWPSLYPVEGVVGDVTTTIGKYCFQNISGTLTALTIGNTVTTIEHEAFMETELLTTLTIPSSVTQIDFWAFTRCYGLNEVIFEGTTPPTFTNKNDGVFHDYCPPVIYVPDSAVSAYRAIDGSVWTNESWSTNIIQPISNRT